MAWTLVQSSATSGTSDPTFAATTAGNVLLAVGSDREGEDSAGTITGWTQIDSINHKPASGTFRMSSAIWTKEADGTEGGDVVFPISVDFMWIGEFEPGIGDDPADLVNLLVASAALDEEDNGQANVDSVTTPTLSPTSNVYIKLGIGVIKKSSIDHGTITYDEDLISIATENFGDSNEMAIGVGLHTDTESTVQDLTASISTPTSRGMMVYYILIPAESAGEDQEVDVPFHQNSVQIFNPTVGNQSPQDVNVPHFDNINQLFLASVGNQSPQEVNVPFFTNNNQLFTPQVFNEGEELFEPILAGNGSLADQIFNGLVSQGFLTGSLADRERARLLSKLVLAEPQNLSLQDLYDLADEDHRLSGLEEPVFA